MFDCCRMHATRTITIHLLHARSRGALIFVVLHVTALSIVYDVTNASSVRIRRG